MDHRPPSKPRIGVTTARRGGIAMLLFNRLAVWRAGGRAIRISPGRPRGIEELDGIVVGGGDDISVTMYRKGGHIEIAPDIRVDHERDRLERDLVCAALDHGVPILGICRGAQMINVALGGTLHEDIYKVYVEAPRLRTPLPRKHVEIAADSRLGALVECGRCTVNALHHQSVDRLGNGLRVVARDEWGIVQAIEMPARRFVVGVQWHPEFLVFSRGQQALFRALVREARGRQTIPAREVAEASLAAAV